MYIKQFEIGPMANFCCLLLNEQTRTAAVIDPGWDGEVIAAEITKAKLKLQCILLTHGHYDHVGAVPEIMRRYNASLYMSEAGRPPQGIPHDKVCMVSDNEIISLGSMEIRCMLTPGHSKDSVCYYTEGALFTGDTLFISRTGRMDLSGGSPKDMYNSLVKIKHLPDSTVVYPGHRYHPRSSASLAEMMKINRCLSAKSWEEFEVLFES